MEPIIDKILITQDEIKEKVAELAKQINEHYYPNEVILIAILNGCLMFFADLVRQIILPIQFDSIGVASYIGKDPNKLITTTKELKLRINGRRVLLVDDIMDTGQTLLKTKQLLESMGAIEVKTCVLLDKPEKHKVDIKPDFSGFVIPNEFVVGYGLDYEEKYRNLPYIATIKTN